MTDKQVTIEICVKEALTKRGMKQRQLAAITGLRPAAISQLCRGSIERLTLDHIVRIAAALNIRDINELVRIKRGE